MKVIFVILPLVLMAGAIFWAVWSMRIKFRSPRKAGNVSGASKKLPLSKLVQFIVAMCLAIAMLFVLIFVPGSIHQVSTGEIAVVKEWGEAKEVKTAGIHYDNWVSKEYVIYDLKTQEITEDINAYSLDAQTMKCRIAVQYKIQGDRAIDIYEKYGTLDILGERITAVAVEQAKVVLSAQSAMEIIENRETLGARLFDALNGKMSPYYVDLSLCVATNIDFSDAFEKVVEDKMIAEQEKLKAQYEKEKAIIQAEQELEVAKLNAEARLAEAEGEANSMRAIAEAEAAAMKVKSIEVARMMGFKIKESDAKDDEGNVIGVQYDIDFEGSEGKDAKLISDYLKYLAYLESWDGKLPSVVTGDGASIIIPTPNP